LRHRKHASDHAADADRFMAAAAPGGQRGRDHRRPGADRAPSRAPDQPGSVLRPGDTGGASGRIRRADGTFAAAAIAGAASRRLAERGARRRAGGRLAAAGGAIRPRRGGVPRRLIRLSAKARKPYEPPRFGRKAAIAPPAMPDARLYLITPALSAADLAAFAPRFAEALDAG